VTVSAEVFELLRLKDRAMDNTKEGITIADCSRPDMPLIYANEAFARITGYSVSESLGKNCRFLQVRGGRLVACDSHACDCVGKCRKSCLLEWDGTPCIAAKPEQTSAWGRLSEKEEASIMWAWS
jgi:PAS domain-containing protein